MTFSNALPLEDQLLQSAPDAMLIVDRNGRIRNSNQLVEKLFGYSREELIGMQVESLMPERLRSRHRQYLSEYFKNPRTRPMGTGLETLSLRRDGSEFETEISLGPLHTPKGTIVLTAIRDISVVKRAQRALEQATYELEKTIEQQDAELLQVAANLRKQVAERLQTDAALGESIRQKTAILNNIPDIAWLKDRDSRFIAVNEPFGEACGVAPAKLVGKTDLDIWPQDLARSYRADDLEVMRTGKRKRVEERLIDSEGKESWIETIKTPIVNEKGEITGTTGIARDVTERKRAEEALYMEKERAQVTLHSIVDGVITTDSHGLVEYLNPVAESLTGWAAAEAKGKPLGSVLQVIDDKTGQRIPDVAARCLNEGRIVELPSHAVLISRDGEQHEIEDSAAPIRARDAKLLGVVLVFHDVSEARRLAKQMAHDAAHDALTGLVNRREFDRRLEKALTSAKEHGAHHALCYLDLDQFKVVNDTAGHAAGDELLKQIRNVLANTFRERDTFARLGGDEFGLLLDNCPLENAMSIAQAAISTIRDHRFVWENRTFKIGVSIGLVPITANSESAAKLLSQADVACYSAKELGRNQFHVYQKEDSEPAQRHIEILRASTLRDALEQERFCLYCQPIISLGPRAHKPVRYEVLIRLQDESGELVLPEEFIPAAERYGMMGEIDRWIIHCAFQSYTARFGDTCEEISINLSGNSLSDKSLLDYVNSRFRECSVPPNRVCFEITETAVIHNLRAATAFINDIMDLGSHIALDDFGNGLSSFRYLKTLPVDYLKIDGNFVKDMHENASDYALVDAINQVGHTMGIQTIAEYAHNQAIVGHLERLGVDYAQGYALGVPAPCPQPSLGPQVEIEPLGV